VTGCMLPESRGGRRFSELWKGNPSVSSRHLRGHKGDCKSCGSDDVRAVSGGIRVVKPNLVTLEPEISYLQEQLER